MRLQQTILLLTAALVVSSAASSNVTVYRNDSFVLGNKLPASHATSDGSDIVNLFFGLSRSTTWKLISKTNLEGDTGEPEGMVRVGDDRLFVSSVQWTVPTEKYNETINGTDRTPGAGFAHLIIYDLQGQRIANASLTAPGDIEYHGGGVDYDGRYIWITLAQYRPNTTATIARIDPLTLEQTRLFRTKDHNGGIVHDTITNELVTLNWGGRNATTWSLKEHPKDFTPLPGFTPPIRSVATSGFFVDYQDCKFLGHHAIPSLMTTQTRLPETTSSARPVMLCGGVATLGEYNLGGLALVDLETMLPLWEVPISLTSDLGVSLTQNPVDAHVVDGKLRVWFLPDQRNSTLYIYEAQ
jgi:hypothetical protein